MPLAKDQTSAERRSFRSYWLQVLVVFIAYFAAGRIGLSTPFTSNNISPVWPASGVALTAVLFFGYRVWPGIATAALLVNWGTIPGVAAAGLACGNTLAGLTGAFLLRRLANLDVSLSRLRDVLGLIGYGALGSTMVSATIGVTFLFATHLHPWSGVVSAWFIVGVSYAAGFANPRAFIYQHGNMVDLNTLTPPNSPIYLVVGGDINDEGVIVGQGCLPADCATGTSFVSYVAIPTGDGRYRVSVTGSPSGQTAFRSAGAPLTAER